MIIIRRLTWLVSMEEAMHESVDVLTIFRVLALTFSLLGLVMNGVLFWFTGSAFRFWLATINTVSILVVVVGIYFNP